MRARPFLALVVLGACSGVQDEATMTTLPDLAEPAVPCGPLAAGEPFSPGIVEARAGFLDELDAIELSGVPDPLDYGAESDLVRRVIGYALGTPDAHTLTRADAARIGALGRVVQASWVRGGGKIDLPFLRRGLQYFDRCTHQFPPSLASLRGRYGDYATWPVTDVACSRPKDAPRRLFENQALGVLVAETHVDGAIREVEVLFTKHRSDGQIAFAAYAADGSLSDRSTFATVGGERVTSGVPYTCMACHVGLASDRYDDPSPTGTGAGCR